MALEITNRLVSAKRHTQGYTLSNKKQVTRNQAIELARKGKIIGVRVVNGPSGRYITSEGGAMDRLYSLPTVVVDKNWKYTKKA